MSVAFPQGEAIGASAVILNDAGDLALGRLAAPQASKGGWRPNDNPKRDSLWLLPSGPDQVGEALVRRRSPRRHMADRAGGRKRGGVAPTPRRPARRGR